MSPAEVLVGARIAYALRRVHEPAGPLTIPLDVVASVDQAIDDLCRLEDGLGAAEVLRLAPYFATLWPSARALARALAEPGTCLPGQVVVELGCGLALPSLVAARLGARAVAVDRHPDVAPLLARNAALSGVEVKYLPGDWTDPAQVAELRARVGRVDLLIASDILYEAEVATALAPALASLCDPDTRVLLADPGRPHLQVALNLLERGGFSSRLEIVRVAGSGDEAVSGDRGAAGQEVFLLELTRAS